MTQPDDSAPVTPSDLADEVLSDLPGGTIYQWGLRMERALKENSAPHLMAWSRERHLTALGNYVKSRSAALAKSEAADRRIRSGVAVATGHPIVDITPTLSVKTDHGRQLMHWFEASPQQFVEAVLREQQVVDGRHNSNAVRMRVVQLLLDNEDLMALPSLEAVCGALDLDPSALDLDSLSA